jgi:hypothetical protein
MSDDAPIDSPIGNLSEMREMFLALNELAGFLSLP